MQQRIEHRYPVTPEVFWAAFLDPTFTEALYLQGLGAHRVEITDCTVDDEGNVRRRLVSEPRIQAPPILQRVLGQKIQFTEKGAFDAAAGLWRFTVEPATMGDRLEVSGERRVIAEPDGCRSVCHLRCRARVLAIGGKLERFIGQQFAGNLEREAAFIRHWFEHKTTP